MLTITEKELSIIIHELLSISSILKNITDEALSGGQKQIIHGCETRLLEIRQEILEKVRNKKK